MTNTNGSPAVDSAREIARRMIARHDRKHAVKVNQLQTMLNKQYAELADAATAVEMLQARVVELERARDAALFDAQYYQRTFDQLLNAMRSMCSDEFAHVTSVLQRMRVQ